jgi:alkylation response protein AidB-like acyl-CoA dehydrogenase
MDRTEKSLQVAEAAREAEWSSRCFFRDLFLGNLRLEVIEPYSGPVEERPAFREFLDRLERFLREEVDPAEIDSSGEYPPRVIEGLKRLGAFGMVIPQQYGGLGFSKVEYGRVMELLGSFDGNLTALLSAHQSIGVPRPLMHFGTESQKRKYLPRCAAGAISAFALTEADAGSDPAHLSATAERSADGTYYVLNGEKLWCTNGTLAELLVVMARDPKTERMSAFIVETAWPGVEVVHRCRFMGLRAIANGVLRFTDVKVPRENLIGEEGKGLKIALTTINTGRLSLPAATVGLAKQCLELSRTWASAREQWGQAIGKHEVIAHELADMAASLFAMEAISNLVESLAESGRFDIRLEAAAAKEWNSVRGWEMVDETLQIRGGRGYETERSLEARGEAAVGVERWMRDSRINRVFEGTSEIMHLFMAREALDRHLKVAGALVDPRAPLSRKLAALPRIALFYLAWYPTRWLGWGRWPRFRSYGRLAGHVRFVERTSRKLARETFHAMVAYRAATQRKQALLFRLVDIANELFAMSAALTRAKQMRERQLPEASGAERLVDLFCRNRRKLVKGLLHALWHNDDERKYRVGRLILSGQERWLEKGGLSPGLTEGDLSTKPIHPARPPAEQAGVEGP